MYKQILAHLSLLATNLFRAVQILMTQEPQGRHFDMLHIPIYIYWPPMYQYALFIIDLRFRQLCSQADAWSDSDSGIVLNLNKKYDWYCVSGYDIIPIETTSYYGGCILVPGCSWTRQSERKSNLLEDNSGGPRSSCSTGSNVVFICVRQVFTDTRLWVFWRYTPLMEALKNGTDPETPEQVSHPSTLATNK